MKTIRKCAYCRDPIYDSQELKVSGKTLPFHKGCLKIALEEVSGAPE